MASDSPSVKTDTNWRIAALYGATLMLAAGAAYGAWGHTFHRPITAVATSSAHAQRQAAAPAGTVAGPVHASSTHTASRSALFIIDAAVSPAGLDRAVEQMNALLAFNGLHPIDVVSLSATDFE